MEVRGVGVDDLAVDLRRARRVAQARLVELRDAQLGGEGLGRVVERRDLALQDVDELAVLTARGVDALEVLERREEVRVDLERALEVSDRLIGLLHLPSSSSPRSFRISLRSRSLVGDVERTRERRPHLLPVRGLLVEARQLAHRADVERIELDDLRVVGLRVLGVPEVVAVPLGEVQAEPDLLLRLRLLLQPAVDRLDDLGPAAGGLRHPLEVARGLAVVEVHRRAR